MKLILSGVFLMLLIILTLPAAAQEPSPTPFGSGNSASLKPSLSADGRYVAFVSDASNLIEGDTNGATDVFVHDRETGETMRVSIASDGTQGDDYSTNVKIAADGSAVVFESMAGNLVEGDTNGTNDIFVHDLTTRETIRVSIASDGTEGASSSHDPTISADGRYVSFWSNANNLVEGDTNDVRDAFVHDRETGETVRVSVASDGSESNGETYDNTISGDGRYVAFWSRASNLVEGDTNDTDDIFVHDLETGMTTRVNVASDGSQAEGYTFDRFSISADGRYIAFQSQATNLTNEVTEDAADVYNNIFVHDRETGETTRVSLVSVDGEALCNDFCLGSGNPVLSGDGRYLVFESDLTGLVAGDTNTYTDIFLHDRQTGTTTRVSVNNSGGELDTLSLNGTISADGRLVAFETSAALVFADFNFTTDVYVHDLETGQVSVVSVFAR